MTTPALRRLLAFALLLIAPITLAAEVEERLDVEPLDDGLWLYRTTIEMSGRPVESNGLVIAAGDGAIVVDTPWNDELTGRLLDRVEASFGRISAVVATHFHGDRLGGIDEVHRRGIASYGHVETARLALENELTAPSSTFESTMNLLPGEGSIELFYPGPGHSPDNIVVWLPERKFLFGGCLLKSTAWSSLGYLGYARVDEWGASLEALLDRYADAETVIPGHGVSGDLDTVRHTHELVRRHLAEAASEGAGSNR